MALTSPRFAGNARLQKAAQNKPAMSFGETGEAVRLVQQALIDLGAFMDVSIRRFGTPDGIFGKETFDRVKSFQAGNQLFPDGIVGRFTLEKMDQLLPDAGPSLPPLPSKTNFKFRVPLHLRALSLTDEPVSRQEQNARMVYAQYGFYLDVKSSMSLSLSPDQIKIFNDVDVGECVDDKLTDELASLHQLGLSGVADFEIVVYFVPKLTDDKKKELNGCAAINTNRPAVVVGSTATQWTMGHELGHVLLGNFDPVHATDTTQLMFAPTANITANPPGFSPDRIAKMQKSPYVLNFS